MGRLKNHSARWQQRLDPRAPVAAEVAGHAGQTLTPYLTLGLRTAFPWWVALISVTAIVSRAVAGIGGMLLFPPVALLIGAAVAEARRERHQSRV